MTDRAEEDKTATEKVAEFVASLDYDDIPGEAIALSKNALLDWLGVSIAGSKEEGVRIIAEYAARAGARGEASAICQGFMTTAELAALVNGTIGHALDYDDTFPGIVRYNIHPSAAVFPAVVAVAEKYGLSGRELLKGYIVGMEVNYRVGAAVSEFIPRSGWHPTPVIGTMGAVAGCASMLGLSPAQTRNALGIAASFAGGLLKNFGSMTKPMHAGNAGRNGVMAAELAADGFTANDSIFDGGFSLGKMFGGERIEGLMGEENDLGKEWRLVSVGIGFKPYPSCRSTHASIGATLHLVNEYDIAPEQVAAIICKMNPIHTQIARFHRPETGYQGKFSIPYCVVTALRHRMVLLEHFTDDGVRDAGAQDLLSRVSFEYPEELSAGGMDLTADITIRLHDGKEYSHRVTFPRGEPENPMTDEELAAKFEACSRLMLVPGDVQGILDTIRQLDETDDLTRLFSRLRQG